MHKPLLVATLAVFASLSLPLAGKETAAPAPAAAPAMPAELAQLDYFIGTWHCTGKTLASPMSAEHATAATVHAAKAIGGRWIQVTYDEAKTAANPMPYHAGIYMGYDAGKKQFVSGCVDNMGGYCTQSSAGWNGDVMVMEGTGNSDGKQFGSRDTFTRKGAGELMHNSEMQGDDKAWTKLDEETCRKAK